MILRKSKALGRIGFILALAGYGGRGLASPADAIAVTRHPTPKVLNERLALSGRIEPSVSASLKSAWGLPIEEIAVSVGDKVKTGDTIAKSDMAYLKYQIEQNEAALRIAQAALTAGHIKLKHANTREAKTAALIKDGVLPANQLETVELQVIAASLEVNEAKKAIQRLQTELERSQEFMKQSVLKSPMNGVVVHTAVPRDQIVGSFRPQPGQLIARIEQPGAYLAVAEVLETQLVRLHVGQKCSVEIPSLGVRACTINTVASVPTPRAGAEPGAAPEPASSEPKGPPLYRVEAKFETEGEMLPSGVVARIFVEVATYSVDRALPWGAIQIEPSGAFVKARSRGGKGPWVKRAVTLGRSDERFVEIVDGLEDHDIVRVEVW